MALLWSNLGMGASTGIHCLSATPNGLAANSLWRICIERPGPYPAGNLPPAGFILFSSPVGSKK